MPSFPQGCCRAFSWRTNPHGFRFSVIYFQTGTGSEFVKQAKNKLGTLDIRQENSQIVSVLNQLKLFISNVDSLDVRIGFDRDC